MSLCCRLLCVVASAWLLALGCGPGDRSGPQRMQLDVRRLPEVPQAVGGAYSGMIGDTLVVAGGSYFPQPPPAPKQWIDSIHLLPREATAWTEVGRLEHPLAYGAAVSTPKGLVLAGGCDAQRHYASAYLLTLVDGRVQSTVLPPLPQPAAYLQGALLGAELYVAGGRAEPDAPQALRTFWRLDLDAPERGWRDLEPWPGPPRMLACVAAQGGAVYVASGAELIPGEGGTPVRRYLTDAYRYRPEVGWQRIADLPHAVVAAPTVAWGERHILVFGGDDGRLAVHGATLGDAHPGFRREVLSYDTRADTWTVVQEIPSMAVTTHASVHGGTVLIPTGEDRPGRRTPAVLAVQPRIVD